jgi:F0F1-type ATP synthase membrane subunit b/b'
MKGFISKEVKYTSEVMNKRFEKIESDINQLESSLKKANLLTISQLEDYSVKLKNFNDSYKEYLEEQRKEDLKKRMELEESMRKNASNLMDICYKKSEFLVEGLKKNI